MKINLAAPTGKAAARLQESVEKALSLTGRPLFEEKQIPVPAAQTLHRLLGYMPSRSRFRYCAERPLPADVVIVDEASMIDLALMYQLLQAVPASARLILVGDKDQLASVEAGAVLGDICYGMAGTDTTEHADISDKSKQDVSIAPPPGQKVAASLNHHIHVLEHSYRFDARSGLGALSRAIKAGDSQRVVSLLTSDEKGQLSLVSHDRQGGLEIIVQQAVDRYLKINLADEAPETAFQLINRFRILTALKMGPFGAESINLSVERFLRRRGIISDGPAVDPVWYRGRPLMVTRNDYNHGLFNGDTGIVMGPFNSPKEEMRVVFPGNDGGFRELAPHQVPEQQTVYAMTIHKSQGSEFDHVMVILPDRDTPLLTRELLYTAVTRARKSVVIWADPGLLKIAVKRRISRSSGLRDALWGGSQH